VNEDRVDADASYGYVYDQETDHYTVTWPQGGVSLPGDTVRRMIRAYSKDGENLTMHEVAVRFALPRVEFDRTRRALGWTKQHEPFTVEELTARDLRDLENETLVAKRRVLARRVERKELRDVRDDAARWRQLEAGTLDPFTRAVESILARRGQDPAPPPRRSKRPAAKRTATRHYMLHYHPSDLHLGLRTDPAYGSADAYNVDEARRRALAGLDDTLKRARELIAAGGVVDYVLLPCGGDFVHSDNVHGRTTSFRHEMDMDGLPEHAFVEGMELYVEMVERVLAEGLTVRIEVVPGNHDYYTSVGIGRAAALVFRHVEAVEVGNAIAPYAYVDYGASGIVLHHGDGLRDARALAENLTMQARKARKNHRFGYAITGNLHHVKQHENGGILLLQQPSPATSDRYAVKGGWTTSRPAVNVFVFDRERGLVETRYVAFD
jgi:hypothetical protein